MQVCVITSHCGEMASVVGVFSSRQNAENWLAWKHGKITAKAKITLYSIDGGVLEFEHNDVLWHYAIFEHVVDEFM